MKEELEGEARIVDLIFLICILTAPFVGSIMGGIITTKLGGYTTRGAFIQVIIIYMILLAACLPISFVEKYYFFGVCLWFIVFVFGYTEPILMGIMLNMVSPPERSTAISVTTFLMMSFGLLPAPYVYGAIYESTLPPGCHTAQSNLVNNVSTLALEENVVCQSKWAMRYISFATIIGGVALFLSFLFRRVSQEAGAERVKERLHEQKDYHNLSSE
jgi:Organic Anion Transporter Polypeptide (OATP) family